MAQPLHAHTILSSPLWHRETVQKELLPATPTERLKEQEQKFRLDCILVERLRYKWSPDIIPKYDAMRDPYARHYFKSPMVQSLLRRTLEKERKTEDSPSSPRSRNSTNPRHRSEFSSPKSPRRQPHNQQTLSTTQPHHSSPSSRQSLNTLSGRHRAPAPPTDAALSEREDRYRIDSVVATNLVTKYKPLIRPYDATEDQHARRYFRKPGVKRVLAITLGTAPKRKSDDVGKDKGGCSIDGPVIDRFIESGSGYRYLHARNAAPGSAKAGHSTDQVSGHGQFLSDAKPMFGFNGEYGYRRNTPWLRQMPSPFGVDTRSPTH